MDRARGTPEAEGIVGSSATSTASVAQKIGLRLLMPFVWFCNVLYIQQMLFHNVAAENN